MAVRHTPKRNRPVPAEPVEEITEFDESAPIDSDFGKPRPPEPISAKESEALEPPITELPPSVMSGIRAVVAQLPESLRAKASTTLNDSIQQYLSRTITELNASNARDMAEVRNMLVQRGETQIREKLQELADKAGPTTPEEMAKVVSQEYLRFPLKIESETDDGEPVVEQFIIRELPQAFERKLTDMLLHDIVPLLPKLQGIKFAANESNISKLQQAITVVPQILDIMAKAVQLCLNPFDKRKHVTLTWVQQNVSTSRQMAILEAQMMASRMRDFFLAVSRVIPRT